MNPDIDRYCVPPDATVREVILCIDRNGKGIALVTDGDRRLLGTLTDGDVRRASLAGLPLTTRAADLLARKSSSPYATPAQAPAGADRAVLLRMMRERTVRQIPLVDADGRVIDLVTIDQLVPERSPPLRAVIMAGGFGRRLRPMTEEIPKPMLPVGDRPILERMVDHLRRSGVRCIHMTTHYRSDKIINHFGDGRAFGVDITYVTEDRPLGTAGALAKLDDTGEPLLVINGDILTEVNFKDMLAYHREHQADLTVGVRQYELPVPYGVVECDGSLVRRIREKPQFPLLVNAGLYLLQPDAARRIPDGERSDMTDLIQRLLDEGRRVVSFPIMEYWLDVGDAETYHRAQEDVRSGRLPK